MPQSHTKSPSDITPSLTITDSNARPSWQRFGTGKLQVEFVAHRNHKWLSIITTEIGDKATKLAMAHLTEDSSKALWELLNSIHGKNNGS